MLSANDRPSLSSVTAMDTQPTDKHRFRLSSLILKPTASNGAGELLQRFLVLCRRFFNPRLGQMLCWRLATLQSEFKLLHWPT